MDPIVWILTQRPGEDMGRSSMICDCKWSLDTDGLFNKTKLVDIKNLERLECEFVPNGPERDFPFCMSMATIASERFADFLESQNLSHLAQKIPIGISNAKELGLKNKYILFNWLTEYDCLDYKASGLDLNSEYPRVRDVVVDASRVPDDAVIFRPTHGLVSLLVTESFAQELDANGFEGLQFDPAIPWGDL